MADLNEKQLETLLGLLREENSRTGKENIVDVREDFCGEIRFEFFDSVTHVGRLKGRLDDEGNFPA